MKPPDKTVNLDLITCGGNSRSNAFALKDDIWETCSLYSSGDEKWYKIYVPHTGSKLDVHLDGPSGVNFDLYLYKQDQTSPYASATTSGADEYIIINDATQSWWYIKVVSVSGSGEFRVKADPPVDLNITSVQASQASYPRGRIATVTVQVRPQPNQQNLNQNDEGFAFVGMNIKDPSGNGSYGVLPWRKVYFTSAEVQAQTTKTLTFNWAIPSDAPSGQYQAIVKSWDDCDPGCEAANYQPGCCQGQNPQDTWGWSNIFTVTKPTLDVQNITVDDSTANQNQRVTITVRVKNNGSAGDGFLGLTLTSGTETIHLPWQKIRLDAGDMDDFKFYYIIPSTDPNGKRYNATAGAWEDCNFGCEDTPGYNGGCCQTNQDTYNQNNLFTVQTGPAAPQNDCVLVYCGAGINVSDGMCNNSGNKLDIVFVGDDFNDKAKFIAVVASHTNKLLSIDPYSTYMDRINVWRVDNISEDLGCRNKNELVDNCSEVIANNSASKCPGHDKVIAIWNTNDRVGGTFGTDIIWNGSTFVTTGTLAKAPKNTPIITVHEFCHSMGLWDEYNYGKNSSTETTSQNRPPGNNIPNCDRNDDGDTPNTDRQNSCTKWDGMGLGCYQHCGFSDWWRPVENAFDSNANPPPSPNQGSIMSYPYGNYSYLEVVSRDYVMNKITSTYN